MLRETRLLMVGLTALALSFAFLLVSASIAILDCVF